MFRRIVAWETPAGFLLVFQRENWRSLWEEVKQLEKQELVIVGHLWQKYKTDHGLCKLKALEPMYTWNTGGEEPSRVWFSVVEGQIGWLTSPPTSWNSLSSRGAGISKNGTTAAEGVYFHFECVVTFLLLHDRKSSLHARVCGPRPWGGVSETLIKSPNRPSGSESGIV